MIESTLAAFGIGGVHLDATEEHRSPASVIRRNAPPEMRVACLGWGVADALWSEPDDEEPRRPKA